MSEHTMAVRDEDLEKIGAYVEAKLPQWLEKISYESGQNWLFHADRALFERVVRIEDQLAGLDRRMAERFDQTDKRFEDINKHFDQTDKRFEDMNTRFEDMNKRFEEMREDMNKRFEEMREDTNTRFEEMRNDMNSRFQQVDKRFEDMNKRFTSTQWLIGIMLTLFMALNTAVQLV